MVCSSLRTPPASSETDWPAINLHRMAVLTLLLLLLVACGSPAPAPDPTAVPAPTPIVVSTPPAQQPAAAQPPPAPALARLPSIADLVDAIEPKVTSIFVESVSRGMFFDFTDQGAGSGVIVRPDGYVVTNYHVIQDVVGIKVRLSNTNTYDAQIVGWDILTDLAVLKIDVEGDLPVADWGDSEDIRVGDWVVAVGNAVALKGGPTVTLGIVSALGRTVPTEREELYGMIQTDAAINDGNSGGPLVNLSGEVVGISTAMFRQAQGIGFAISSETALPIIDSLIENGRVVRPLIGFDGADVTTAIANRLGLNVKKGIIISRIATGGPAFRAGLDLADVIVSMDGIPTNDMGSFLTLLWTHDVGDSVHIEYMRDNKLFETAVVLEERPP